MTDPKHHGESKDRTEREEVVDTEYGERSACCGMIVATDLFGDGVDRCSGCRYPLRLSATISAARTYDVLDRDTIPTMCWDEG